MKIQYVLDLDTFGPKLVLFLYEIAGWLSTKLHPFLINVFRKYS